MAAFTRFADDKIKDEYLPLFAEGKVTGAMVLTEPDAGSDLVGGISTKAQMEGDSWVINGSKAFRSACR